MLHRRRANSLSASKWSQDEEAALLRYITRNDAKEIKKISTNRSKAAIRAKTRKLKIKYDLFGESYRNLKQDFTKKIANKISPNVVYEAYAGAGHQTLIWIENAGTVYATDKSVKKKKQFFKNILKSGFKQYKSKNNWFQFKKGNKQIFFYHGDTVSAAASLRYLKIKVDLIDLDTCGSSLPVLSSLLALLNPAHLVITHGEFHSLRFGREDVLRRILFHKDISVSPFPMSIEQMSMELDKAVKISSLRAHNETCDSYWATLKDEIWLGNKAQGMLRRYYRITKPKATSDCLNELIDWNQ